MTMTDEPTTDVPAARRGRRANATGATPRKNRDVIIPCKGGFEIRIHYPSRVTDEMLRDWRANGREVDEDDLGRELSRPDSMRRVLLGAVADLDRASRPPTRSKAADSKAVKDILASLVIQGGKLD
jgi:hypothetical protein